MKNLRKVLAVVLVICMAFSLVTIASAKSDFSDQASVTNTEAVDVMSALNIMVGSGTTFDPTGTFTREQAAKVIAYLLLGGAIADNLAHVTSNFKDVDMARWSNPYIEYCVSKGIIVGLGDGTFAPTAPVTGTQFAKMLLTALGYGKNGEFTGASWEINALTQAIDLGILTGTANFSTAAARQNVAQYAFNALNLKFQIFSKDTSSYSDSTVTKNTFALKLGLGTVNTLVNGVAGYKYQKNSVDITGVYPYDNLIGKSADGTAFGTLSVAATGNTKFIAAVDASTKYYYNGVEQTGAAIATATGEAVNKGVVVSFLNSDTDAYADSVVIVKKTVATVASVDATAGTVTIGGTAYSATTASFPAGLVKDDVVLMYTDSTAVTGKTYIEKAASVSAKLTALTGSNFVFGSQTYSVAALTGVSVSLTAADLNADKVVYLDSNGYIVMVTGPASVASTYYYGYGIAYAQNYFTAGTFPAPDTNASEQIKFVDSTGTVRILSTTLAASATTTGAITTSGAVVDKLFAYTLSSDGKIASVTAAASITAGADVVKGAAYSYTAGSAYVASAATVFFYKIGTAAPYTYQVYTGYANAASTSSATAVSAANGNGAVLLTMASAPASTVSTASYAFVKDNTVTTTYDTATSKYVFTVNAFDLTGAAITLKETSSSATVPYAIAKGIVSYTTTNGFVTSALTDLATGTNAVSQVESTFFVAGSVVYYNASTSFYKLTVDGSGNITAVTKVDAAPTVTTNTLLYASTSSSTSPAAVVFYK